MNLPDDEIRRRILTILDRYYEEDFDAIISVDDLAKDLNLDRPTVDRHLAALCGKELVWVSSLTTGGQYGHYYVRLTPFGKDEWDRRRGNQYHFVLRQRIRDRLKQVDDQEHREFTTSEALAVDLGVERNAICINLVALEREGLVELREMGGGLPSYIVRLTPKGRAAAEEPRIDINFCFVLMPFEDAFDPVYEEAIKPGAEDAGMWCARADKVRDNRAVIEKIKGSIQRAGIIVADMTGDNPNVFYEIGYAHGLGKECILITQASSEKVPFDIRHLEHIKYTPSQEGLAKLRRDLKETIVHVRSRGL